MKVLVKKGFKFLAVVTVCFLISFVFVACKGDDGRDGDGVIYSVSFDLAGGIGEVEEQSVESGKTAKKVDEPIRDGYNFLGWYNGENKWDFGSHAVTGNVSLVAKWEKNEEDWEGTQGISYMALGSGKYAVTGYTGVDTLVIIPKMVEVDGVEGVVSVISNGAFKGQADVTEVVLSSGVTSIGDEAFSGTSIVEIMVPKNVTNIGEKAFYNTKRLKKIKVENFSLLKVIGAEAFVGTRLTSVIIPDSVEIIGNKAFKGLGLTSVLFGSKSALLTIGEEAFMGTSLTIVDMPEGITTIGKNAFSDIPSLTKVVIPSTLKVAGDNIFYGSDSLEGLFLRGESLDETNFSYSWNSVYANTLSVFSYYPSGAKVAGSWRYVNGMPNVWEKEVEFLATISEEDLSEGGSAILFAYTFDGKYEHKYILERGVGDNYYAEIDILKYDGYRIGLFNTSENAFDILSADKISRWYDTDEFNVVFALEE